MANELLSPQETEIKRIALESFVQRGISSDFAVQLWNLARADVAQMQSDVRRVRDIVQEEPEIAKAFGVQAEVFVHLAGSDSGADSDRKVTDPVILADLFSSYLHSESLAPSSRAANALRRDFIMSSQGVLPTSESSVAA